MPGGICVVTFKNDCPREWGVVIVQVGAKFFYQDTDGTIIREWYGTKNTDIRVGQSDTFSSDDSRLC